MESVGPRRPGLRHRVVEGAVVSSRRRRSSPVSSMVWLTVALAASFVVADGQQAVVDQ